jgi:predicted phage terminase large subunit-like protein
MANEIPHTKEALARKYLEGRAMYNQMLKEKTSKNLYLFNKYVLGTTEGTGKVPLGKFHIDLCKFVQNNRDRKKLILVPRGHLKSTLITVGYPIFRLVENPNIRTLILNATWQMAVDFLSAIKDHLQKNKTLHEVFGDFSKNPLEWSQDRITINRPDTGVRGPTIWATGVESNLTGSHPDLIIMDDLVNRQIADSKDQMDKVILRYKDALDLLEPGGQLVVIGTRWIDGDFYEWIMNPENGVIGNYDVFIRSAFDASAPLSQVFGDDGDMFISNQLWPEKFSVKELRERYTEKGSYEFSAQYMNNPVPEDEQTFKKDWFRKIDIEDWTGKHVSRYLTVDPAISLKKEADFTAMVVTEVDQYGNILVRHIERVKVPPSQMIDMLFQLHEIFNFKLIGVEDVAYQKALQYTIREEMQRRGRKLPIVEIRPQDRSKDQRIKALQPLYANGKIFHSRTLKNLEYLEDELLRFPRGKHDDVIDALSYQLDLIVPPRQNVRHNTRRRYLYG